MDKQLFRQKSIDHISSPEELHDYMRVTSPKLWMLLTAIVVLLAGFIVYASTAHLENTVTVKMDVQSFEDSYTLVNAQLPLTYDNVIKTDMKVRLGNENGKVSGVYNNGDGYIFVIVEMDNQHLPIPDGEYDVVVVIEDTTPISFLWN
ncbi:MAG: hypothetical protein E7386_08490 [Ruminococcaceae bacterium]|nr:hypothetical protein [Oscillospiraceae bacterium]